MAQTPAVKSIVCVNAVRSVTLEGQNPMGNGILYIDLVDYPDDPAKVWFKVHLANFPSVTQSISQCQTGCDGTVANGLITLTNSTTPIKTGSERIIIQVDRTTGSYSARRVDSDKSGQVFYGALEDGTCSPVTLAPKF